MKKIVFITVFTSMIISTLANACTGFGTITENGTIIGKNRDFLYTTQKFEYKKPESKFIDWYGNPYHHHNAFYAIMYSDGVSMGINQKGLSAIEEDVLSNALTDTKKDKAGMPDGEVLYAVLQNFNTIDEMIPYLSTIFSQAAPDFYQFSDAKKILTIEVANGKSPNQKKVHYMLLSQKNNFFVHTNIYTSDQFLQLNNQFSQNKQLSSKMRLSAMTNFMSHSHAITIQNASQWLMNTNAISPNKNNPMECLNLSLFRSDLQHYKLINENQPNNKIYGTVATMIVHNTGNFKNSYLYLMMIKSIKVNPDGSQTITYKKRYTTLWALFHFKNQDVTTHTFVRSAPINGICQ